MCVYKHTHCFISQSLNDKFSIILYNCTSGYLISMIMFVKLRCEENLSRLKIFLIFVSIAYVFIFLNIDFLLMLIYFLLFAHDRSVIVMCTCQITKNCFIIYVL